MTRRTFTAAAFVTALVTTLALHAQEPAAPSGEAGRNQDPWAPATFNDFRLRAIGPALMSGRISHIAVHPGTSRPGTSASRRAACGRPRTQASPSRRSSRTRAATPSAPSSSIRRAPSTVWVGTGESNNQRSVGWGDGVYRSDDGGRTWRNLGLKNLRADWANRHRPARFERRVTSPRTARSGVGRRARACTRPPTAERRGTRCSTISENTGISDVAIDPTNPDVRARGRAPAPAARRGR